MSGVEDDGLGDWRLAAATRLAEDLPAAFPGGPSHKAGTPVRQAIMVDTRFATNVGFAAPSACALALSASLRSAERANELWNRRRLTEEIATPEGNGKGVEQSVIPDFFSYLEEASVAALTAFQAIEAYANFVIGSLGPDEIEMVRKGAIERWPKDQIERFASDNEKLKIVLPALTGKPSLAKSHIWPEYCELKAVRDGSVHFKSADQNPQRKSGTEDPLFRRLLSVAPEAYPRTAVRTLSHFAIVPPPRWLEHLLVTHRDWL